MASLARATLQRLTSLRGGVAPVWKYLPGLLDDVLAGRVNPGLMLDHETDLAGVTGAYAAMDERRAIKSMLRVSSPT